MKFPHYQGRGRLRLHPCLPSSKPRMSVFSSSGSAATSNPQSTNFSTSGAALVAGRGPIAPGAGLAACRSTTAAAAPLPRVRGRLLSVPAGVASNGPDRVPGRPRGTAWSGCQCSIDIASEVVPSTLPRVAGRTSPARDMGRASPARDMGRIDPLWLGGRADGPPAVPPRVGGRAASSPRRIHGHSTPPSAVDALTSSPRADLGRSLALDATPLPATIGVTLAAGEEIRSWLSCLARDEEKPPTRLPVDVSCSPCRIAPSLPFTDQRDRSPCVFPLRVLVGLPVPPYADTAEALALIDCRKGCDGAVDSRCALEPFPFAAGPAVFSRGGFPAAGPIFCRCG
mmetsp:Transcript_53449/g.125709  ORF Transcript_53449/g.125709 Transcript_53449/m.125709 type:complete len:341 (-) Transcript_53449:1313-2335(-)